MTTITGSPSGLGVALRFLAAARRDSALRERLAAQEPKDLVAVVQAARQAGFGVSAEDLRAAFAVDWGMRRARYLRDD
jgi:predicted ribosomally synthesized peptide with nif11-like leader